ncbi:hypothetical protein GCM10022221_26160 [Actinocorallia aurea]
MIAALAYAGIVSAIMQTLVVPLIAEFPSLLHTTASNASWIITVTLLTGAVATPVAGKLGDMYGKKRIVLILTVPMIIGSVLCAVAPNVGVMIAGRGLQGLGIGIVPLGISLLKDVIPPARLHSSIALMSASMGVGGALGLPLAAAVAEHGSWRLLSWMAAALSVLITVAVAVWVPPVGVDAEERGRFDLVGALVLSVVLVCLLLAVSKGNAWGWSSAAVIGLLAAAVVIALAWGWWELRTANPMIDLRTTARPVVLWTNIASFLVGFAMYAQSLVFPQLLQLPTATGYGLGQSMIAMGLWMAPSGIMMMAMSPVGAKITRAHGAKVTLAVGAVVVACGYLSAQLLLDSAPTLLISTILTACGVGLAYGAMPALIMAAVPHHETGAANAFNSLTRSVGSSIAAAVMGAVLAGMTLDLGGHAVPSLGGFRVALAIGAGVAVLSAVIAAALPTRGADAAATAQKTPASVH